MGRMKRNRNLLVGTTFAALLLALGTAQVVLERTANAQAKNTVMAPRFEVDPMWPKPLPNHWIYGNVIGVERRRTRSCLHHSPHRHPAAGQYRSEGGVCHPHAAGVRMLLSGAAGRRVRSRRQSGEGLGRSGAKALAGRRRITASRSTRKASSTSAATAPTMDTS